MKKRTKLKRKYLITLYQTRSIVALVAGILVLCCTMAAVAVKIQVYAFADENRLHFFTVQSNLLSAVGAAFMIPYAIEGIRRKRFTLPRWLVIFQYSGATCVAITLITTLILILPTQGKGALMGTDFWLHLITPLCTVALFQCVETGVILSRKHMIIALIPYWLYMIVYYIEVIIIGKENGGWGDFYMTTAFWPAWVSIILMLTIGFCIAFFLRMVHNKLAIKSRNRIMEKWDPNMEPHELLTEAFGLGRYMGAHCDASDLVIPVDVFSMMEQRYTVTIDALTKAFVKGAMDALKDRQIV